MEVEINQVNEYEMEMAISAPWDQVKTDYSDLLKTYAKVPVKGFRPSKAPLAAIEKRFRKELQSDLASVCAERLCRKALDAHNLKAGSPISINEISMHPGWLFAFRADFLKMPEFELPAYAALDLQTQTNEEKCTEISEKLLERTLFELHHRFVDRELVFSDPEDYTSEEESRQAASDRVRLLLILKKIADVNAIEVDDHDVNARIQEIAKENDSTPSEVKAYLLETGGLSRLRDILLAESVLNYLIEINA